ncbi:hypothetical protein HanXRQr2_Chr04g0180441 [Helianthus annuus]|uniref:Uncharacterized protein n=1 Tax=Helianthus annuus TaxID=4232 RepID=A0A9K3NSN0_HELAN|nr:hypothetical protein HanXRQr2_Chr04g0180441 [Helianthus annuus]KAJ0932459.1 hypothetical protein HanPSC8_Chr04g0173861 [Helianthus annuus]
MNLTLYIYITVFMGWPNPTVCLLYLKDKTSKVKYLKLTRIHMGNRNKEVRMASEILCKD